MGSLMESGCTKMELASVLLTSLHSAQSLPRHYSTTEMFRICAYTQHCGTYSSNTILLRGIDRFSRVEEYAGGFAGYWSVDAADKFQIGIAEAALQMLSLNDDTAGLAGAISISL